MAQPDWETCAEVTDIMEEFLEHFPQVFVGFDVNEIAAIKTKSKRSKKPVRLVTITYPRTCVCDKVYIVEAFEDRWDDLDRRRKRLAVFHTMLQIPEGGFDPESKSYGKRRKPEYELFLEEYAAAGGVPNWMENPAAVDPIEKAKAKASKKVDDVQRSPVTVEHIAGDDEEE